MARVRRRAAEMDLRKVETSPAVFREITLDNATGFVTVPPDDAVWSDLISVVPDAEGSFVRLSPPVGTTPEELAQVKDVYRAAGASVVRSLPIPQQAVAAPQGASNAPPLSLVVRDVVMARAARLGATVRCKEDLERMLERCLDQAGV